MEIHRNAQWVVTPEGVKAPTEGGYWIDMGRIGRTTERRGISYYDCPICLAEKEWVDRPLFFEAFVFALRFHSRQTGEAIDEAMLGRSYIRAMDEIC